jgi:hypothetical protein
VVIENHVLQMGSAGTFVLEVVEVLQGFIHIKGFTSHFLGGWLAQVTTFTTECLKREGNFFLRSYNGNYCYHPHTVVFESPGCKIMLSEMRDTSEVCVDGCFIDLDHLDITSYFKSH